MLPKQASYSKVFKIFVKMLHIERWLHVWTNCTFVFYTNIWGKANTCKSYKNKNRHRKNV